MAVDLDQPGRHWMSIGFNAWMAIIRWWLECFLDRSRRYPPREIPYGTRLVIGARRSRAAERLLADYRPRRLIIDVEVAGGVAKPLSGPPDGYPITAADTHPHSAVPTATTS